MPELLEAVPVEQDKPVFTTTPTHDEIEVRAYFHYVDRGCTDGCALDDWLAAEEELRREAERQTT